MDRFEWTMSELIRTLSALAKSASSRGIESAALAVVNAVIPTLAAMGAYELVFAKLDK